MTNLWLSGYRKYELSIFDEKDPKYEVIYYALKQYLIGKIETGTTWLLTGGQSGIEQWSLQALLELQADYPEIKGGLILPFQDFGAQWKPESQEKLNFLKNKADYLGYVSEKPYHAPQQLRNYQQFMLRHADEAALVYDPEFEGKTKYDYALIKRYQDGHNFNLELLDMDWLQNQAQEYSENTLQ